MKLTGILRLASGLFAAAAAVATVQAGEDQRYEFPHFGDVVVTLPAGRPERVVLFISGDGGWNSGVRSMGRALVERGALVAGIDIRHYIAWLNANGGGRCNSLAVDFENLAHALEKRVGLSQYQEPILTGYSSGATLAYATVAEAPRGTFAGAISLGFCPDLPIRTPVCRGEGLEYDLDAKARNTFFRPRETLGTPWITLQGQKDQVCDYEQARSFIGKAGNAAELVSLPLVGHGYGVTRNWQPQFLAAHERLASAGPDIRPDPATVEPNSVADLPLIEVPVTATAGSTNAPEQGALAIILSGDGGWAGLDKEVATELAARGVPVVGLSSLKYFWHARTADVAAHDLQRIISHYLAAWHRQQVILIGYSFGADVLPSLVNRLPAATLPNLRSMTLIGLSDSASFEVHVSEWIPGGKDDGTPNKPEIERLPALRVQCLYGDSETDSACRGVRREGWSNVELKGGHHFGGDYGQVAEQIVRFANLGASR